MTLSPVYTSISCDRLTNIANNISYHHVVRGNNCCLLPHQLGTGHKSFHCSMSYTSLPCTCISSTPYLPYGYAASFPTRCAYVQMCKRANVQTWCANKFYMYIYDTDKDTNTDTNSDIYRNSVVPLLGNALVSIKARDYLFGATWHTVDTVATVSW